jgi:L-asparaginase
MGLPHVAVASLGGTITMTAGSGGTVTPTLSADDLVAAVPGLSQAAHIETATLASLPSASLTFADVLRGLDWARSAVGDRAAGAVLIQGTDTLEETAYLLDLHWDRPEPLVLTGAMRSPQTPGADGPANVLASVLTAASPRSRSLGALVVMNDEVHAAARVRKSDATSQDAFQSPSFGPLGRIREGEVVYANRPGRWPHLPRPDVTAGTQLRVALIETCLDDDGGLLRLVPEAGYAGVVVAAFGAGHVSRRLADVVGEVAREIPVVYASRTGAGPTLSRTYGFIGSESDLLARGAVPAGWLDSRKARILLWSLLAAGADRETIRNEFARRGGCPGGPA